MHVTLFLDKLYENFIIPELPSGDSLVIDILSTWGDKHYVGLNGIEIFSNTGEPARIKEIRAHTTGVNQLLNNNCDPYIINNLINGINRTRDDANLWLTPYSNGDHHYIYMIFEYTITVAMIRIWVGLITYFMSVKIINRCRKLCAHARMGKKYFTASEIIFLLSSRTTINPEYIPLEEPKMLLLN